MRAFRCLECRGMARVDFFLERSTGKILVNEVNTIPGFTSISMYPKLWEASGLSYRQLIDRAQTSRGEFLELIVIVLIAIEIVIGVVGLCH